MEASQQSTSVTRCGSIFRQSFGSPLSILLTLAVVVLALASLLSLAASRFWIADLLANLRIQQALALLACAALAATFRSPLAVAISLISLGLHAPAFFVGMSDQLPAVTQDASQPIGDDTKTIRLTTANVLTSNRRFAEIENELIARDADVVAIIEISTRLQEHLSGDFSTSYPYSIVKAQDSGNFGIALYSKRKWEAAKFVWFNDPSIPSIIATVELNGQRWTVLATHTLPPIGPDNFAHRNRHLKHIAKAVNSLRRASHDTPVVVMGDLNVTPWSPIFQRLLADSRLKRAGVGNVLTPTWYRLGMFPFGLVLDHILATADLNCQTSTVSPDVGSDHRFVTADLQLRRGSERSRSSSDDDPLPKTVE